jgi:hypothetical protein
VIGLVIGVVDFTVQQLQGQSNPCAFRCGGYASETVASNFGPGLIAQAISIAAETDQIRIGMGPFYNNAPVPRLRTTGRRLLQICRITLSAMFDS